MEKKVANILLGETEMGDSFDIKWGIFTFHLDIKPITAKQIIAISGEISLLKDYDKDAIMFPTLMENSADLKHIANIIAIATGTKWKRFVARAILNLDLKDINTLFNIVYKQSNPAPFFFITELAKGRLNLLEKKKE